MTPPGSPLRLEARGRGRGEAAETFLLIHGFGATAYTWRHWAPALERRGRVLLVELKGFGGAGKPDDGRYGPLDQAALVGALVAAEEPRRLTLIGHSIGGGIALLTALSMLDGGSRALHRLVVVAGTAYAQRLPPVARMARWPRLARAVVRLVGPDLLIREVLRSIVHDPAAVEPGQVEAYAAPLRSGDGVRAALDAAGQLVPAGLDGLTARYRDIDVPALLMWGRQDRVVPPWVGQRLARDLPRATLEVLEACGHIPQEERPGASLALLEAFLDRSGAAGAAPAPTGVTPP